jgi:plastocyanin
LRKLLILAASIAAVCAVPALAAATKTTTLQDDFFTKPKLSIKRNTTVIWTWKTDEKHTVTEISGKWGSKETKDGRFKHKFAKKGKFTVYCLVHPTVMRQRITVK